MKIQDVYLSLTETLDKPLPYTKLSPTRYLIELEGEQLLVILHSAQINNYNCLAVTFINPNSTTPMAITNYFNGPGAVRVLSTIITIVEQIPFNIVVFTPDDITIEIENKKARLYEIVMKRMQRVGKISYYNRITLPEFTKPILVGVRGTLIDDQALTDTIKQFGVQKLTNE